MHAASIDGRRDRWCGPGRAFQRDEPGSAGGVSDGRRIGRRQSPPSWVALNVDPNTGGLAIAARIAAIADAAGLEYAGVQDHPYNPDFVDTLTHITWLAAHTSRVHLFPNVANLPLRPPAMLAERAATTSTSSAAAASSSAWAPASSTTRSRAWAARGALSRTPGRR